MKGNLTTTEKLILNLINPYADEHEVENLFLSKIDWKDFLVKSHCHGIAPLIYYNLKKRGLLLRFPDSVTHNVRSAYLYSSRTNITLGKELKEILHNFSQDGIFCIVLKGHAFIETIYQQNPGVRPLKDIDLLLRKEDIEQASSILRDMGYEFYDQNRSETYYLNSHFHLPFQKKAKNRYFHVELHWQLNRPGCVSELPIESYRQRAVEIDLLGEKAYMLHPEDALLYLCWHTALNGFDKLLSLADMLYLIQYHHHSWDQISQNIKKANLTTPYYWTSYIISGLFNSRLLPTCEINIPKGIFTKIYFTKRNIVEQFISSDWTIRYLVRIFLNDNISIELKKIRIENSFKKTLKVYGHLTYSFMKICFRYIELKF